MSIPPFFSTGHSDSDGDTIVSPTFATEPTEHVGVYTEKPVLTSKQSLRVIPHVLVGSREIRFQGVLTVSTSFLTFSWIAYVGDKGIKPSKMNWGESDPKARGPIVISRLANSINIR